MIQNLVLIGQIDYTYNILQLKLKLLREITGRPVYKIFDSQRFRLTNFLGEIKWKNELVFVSRALIGERVRLQEIADGQYQLFLGPNLLAVRDRDNENWLPPTNRTPATGRKPAFCGNAAAKGCFSGQSSREMRPPSGMEPNGSRLEKARGPDSC